MDLVHVLELAGSQASGAFKPAAAAVDVGRVVADMERQVAGGGVGESHPDAGPDFRPPGKHLKPQIAANH
jgi:hypothetical protein